MKGIRAAIIATIVTCLIIVSCAYAMPAGAEAECLPKLTVVVSKLQIGPKLWEVSCLDRQGDEWAFYCDNGSWDRGDIVNLLMQNNTIVEVYWEGYVDNIEDFFQIIGW
jgi:hypothetical protein